MTDKPRVVEIFGCPGPPVCDLDEEAMKEAMRNGCPWCERQRLMPDGTWQVVSVKPGNA